MYRVSSTCWRVYISRLRRFINHAGTRFAEKLSSDTFEKTARYPADTDPCDLGRRELPRVEHPSNYTGNRAFLGKCSLILFTRPYGNMYNSFDAMVYAMSSTCRTVSAHNSVAVTQIFCYRYHCALMPSSGGRSHVARATASRVESRRGKLLVVSEQNRFSCSLALPVLLIISRLHVWYWRE